MPHTRFQPLLFGGSRKPWRDDATLQRDPRRPGARYQYQTDGPARTASLASLALYGSSVGASTSDIAEIAFGVGALPTSDERDKIFGRLHHKWGLEALLDALHPYKAAPP